MKNMKNRIIFITGFTITTAKAADNHYSAVGSNPSIRNLII